MLVYNITIKVENEILPGWIAWMQQEFIPDMMALGLLTETKFFQLLEEEDDACETFVLQYYFPDQNNYDAFITHHEKKFNKISLAKWGDRWIDFRTKMKTVQ